jgi:hypothetical protein
MKTYDLKDEAGRVIAFEVGNLLLTRGGACRLVRRIPGCRVIRWFSLFMRWSVEENEVFCEFEVDGLLFVIMEPWGDSSRFWVGPKTEEGVVPTWSPAVDRVWSAFSAARLFFGIIM